VVGYLEPLRPFVGALGFAAVALGGALASRALAFGVGAVFALGGVTTPLPKESGFLGEPPLGLGPVSGRCLPPAPSGPSGVATGHRFERLAACRGVFPAVRWLPEGTGSVGR
jgi:hypothetical protein